ncbi:MAG: PQQ-binding-like beta-propeller repeat protein [Prolixibacteraceae bacterium]|jgi:outer membrane protein assembly factor BamB|nr:PQQ-binding-like beta-propeller repeat protein [Prolixibacteraceae bacterium]MDD4756357.1 PQQ-binding-like beta-propeller repeat protein [Prolixibacteraceae bacterium]NLO02015.1 PQQ-binding-like beta-propeller repeat protein [Bacteroidales bacterium]
MKLSINLLFLFLFVIRLSGQTADSWPIFRGDRQLTGISRTELPDKPELLWAFQTEDNIKAAPVVEKGMVVIGSTDGIMYCLNKEGKIQWKFKTDNAIEAPALIHNNTVYFGNLDGTLFAVDLATGEKKWDYDTDNQIIGSPNWWEKDGVTYIFAGSYDYYLHCVDAGTGEVKWKYESDNFINGAPACIDGKIYFGGCDGFLHVVDVETGEAEKKIDVANYVPGSPAVEKDKAYLGDYDGRFFQVDIIKETTTWEWKDESTTLPFIASPAIAGNRLLIANHNKFLYCFDKNSGKKLWEYNTGNRVEASPVVAGNKVVVANMRGDLALVSLSDGKVIWSYETGSQIVSNPAVAGGRIYVGGSDGNMYCFGKK